MSYTKQFRTLADKIPSYLHTATFMKATKP